MENVTSVVLDLGKLQYIRGVQVQGGVPDNIFYGPACFSESWYWVAVFCIVTIFLSAFGWRSPYMGVLAGFGCSVLFVAIVMLTRIFIFMTDPAVPWFFSDNPICPTVGVPRTFRSLIVLHICLIVACIFWVLVQAIRPQRFNMFFVCTIGLPFIFNGAITPAFGVSFQLVVLLFFWSMYTGARFTARRDMVRDNAKYEKVWGEATTTEESSLDEDLEAIHNMCMEKHKTLKQGTLAAYMFKSHELTRESEVSSAGMFHRVLYRIGATGLGRFSRTGKIRQATGSIDDLFIEVCIFIVNQHRR
jgi:hypothetical protein